MPPNKVFSFLIYRRKFKRYLKKELISFFLGLPGAVIKKNNVRRPPNFFVYGSSLKTSFTGKDSLNNLTVVLAMETSYETKAYCSII